jgi:hypothetical protein
MFEAISPSVLEKRMTDRLAVQKIKQAAAKQWEELAFSSRNIRVWD